MNRLSCVLIVLLILSGYPSSAQYWLNKDRSQITNEFRDMKIAVSSTDSTLIFKTNSPKLKPAEKVFYFDSNGKCDRIVSVYDCEKCYLEEVKLVIKSRRYKWVQVDSLNYVTHDKINAELHLRYQNQPFAYILKRVEAKLIENKLLY